MKTILRPRVYVPVLIVVLIILGFMAFGGSEEGKDTVVATEGPVEYVVSVTGTVKPDTTVDLAFQNTGRVEVVSVKEGDVVAVGTSLASLENADLYADLAEANADLKARQAKLTELQNGSLPQEIQIEQVKLDTAKRVLENKKLASVNVLQDAYTKGEDAVHNTIDQFFSNGRSTNPAFNLPSDSRLKSSIESERLIVEGVLSAWGVRNLTVSSANLDSNFSSTTDNMNAVKSLLDKVALAINALTTSSSLSQTTLDGYKAAVSAARTSINSEIATLSDTKAELDAAKDSIMLSESELALKKTPTRPEQLQAQEASVEQAQAKVQNIRAQLSKSVLRSPIAGVVSFVDVQLGEIVSANTPAVSVISQGTYEIEAYMPEANIADVHVGDVARIRLDAYADHTYTAKVTTVNPAETIRDGVSTYKITLHFDNADTHVRPGMTANIEVVSASVQNAVIVPARAVSSRDGKEYVDVLENGSVVTRTVTIGVRGSDGKYQITSGVRAGETVVLQ